MKYVYPETMDFFNVEVTNLIMQRYKFDKFKALKEFMMSKTYKLLANYELRVWYFSPLVIFDMWENERKTGNLANSTYLRE